MEITPAQAREFLKLNATNRPLRLSHVRTLCGVLERGEWKVTHQGIAITSENQLIDGQHRLQAIAQTGMTVRMLVSFDCDPSTYTVLDGGIKRTVQDHLGIPVMVGTIARLLWKLPNHTLTGSPSSQQVASVLAWSRDAIDEVCAVAGTKSKFTSSSVQLPVVVHVMAGNTDALEMMAALKNLDFDAMTPSLKSLTKQIMEGKASTRNNQWDLSARVWRAFNPANWANSRVQVKEVSSSISEMSKVVEHYRKKNSARVLKAVA